MCGFGVCFATGATVTRLGRVVSSRLHLRGFRDRHRWEIDFGFSDVVGVVREDIGHDVGKNFQGMGIGVAGGFEVGELLVGHESLAGQNRTGKSQGGLSLWVVGFADLSVVGLFIGETRAFADGGVGRDAVIAAVLIADGQGDLFAEFGIEITFGEGFFETEVGRAGSRGMGEGGQQIGDATHFLLNALEHGLAFALGGVQGQGLDAGHGRKVPLRGGEA